MYQLPFSLLDGYMRLHNLLIFIQLRISKLSFFCLFDCIRNCHFFVILLSLMRFLCRWWSLVEKSWGIVQTYPQVLPFYSDFNQVKYTSTVLAMIYVMF